MTTSNEQSLMAWLLLHDTDRSTSPEPVLRLPRGIDFRDEVWRLVGSGLEIEATWRKRVRANEQRRVRR